MFQQSRPYLLSGGMVRIRKWQFDLGIQVLCSPLPCTPSQLLYIKGKRRNQGDRSCGNLSGVSMCTCSPTRLAWSPSCQQSTDHMGTHLCSHTHSEHTGTCVHLCGPTCILPLTHSHLHPPTSWGNSWAWSEPRWAG